MLQIKLTYNFMPSVLPSSGSANGIVLGCFRTHFFLNQLGLQGIGTAVNRDNAVASRRPKSQSKTY